jgi:ribosome-associated translation inhibitor RaiA
MQFTAEEYHLQMEIDAKEYELTPEERTRMKPDLDRIGEAVKDFPAGQLWLTIVYHPRSNVFHAQAKLKLPGTTIIAGHHDPSLEAAVGWCADKVVRRIKAYQAQPDHAALDEAQQRAELDRNLVAPTEPDAGKLGEAVQYDDYSAFRVALLKQEERLRKHVGRWVQRYPEVQAQIGPTFAIADIVEEVFLQAFEEYANRPLHIPFHEWLESLTDGAIQTLCNDADELTAARATVSAGPGLTTEADMRRKR